VKAAAEWTCCRQLLTMAVVEEVLWRRQVIYQEKEKIEGTLKRQAPLLKGFNEFEYGFKIRDKENPKNWCVLMQPGLLMHAVACSGDARPPVTSGQ
jgi:hypothetical protein